MQEEQNMVQKKGNSLINNYNQQQNSQYRILKQKNE